MSLWRQPPRPAEAGCPKGLCDGSGWLLADDGSATRCACRAERARRSATRGLTSVVPSRYRRVSFDSPPVSDMDRTIVEPVRSYVDRLEANLDAGRSLWFEGSVGTGKTTLAMLVSAHAARAGRTVAIYSLPKLLARIRRTYDAGPGEDDYFRLFERLTDVDLLHIDDLGAEKSSDWVLEQLYALINERYEAHGSVVVTTNLPHEELEEQIGHRTVSRLVEMCDDPIQVYGPDQRWAGGTPVGGTELRRAG